jgi:hypothetical protein
MTTPEQLQSKYATLRPVLDERALRLWAAAEVQAYGRGGMTLVAAATGVARTRIATGLAELRGLALAPPEGPAAQQRIRRPGGGRKPLPESDPTLLADLEAMVDPVTRGDPQTPLRRVPLGRCKSTTKLAAALVERGHRIDARTVARLLKEQHYSLQSTRKTLEGGGHPDRDAQFSHINTQAAAFQERRQPVISVDAQKKELIGAFQQGGQEWQPAKCPVPVHVHDFPDPKVGKGIPYGVYDVAANQGWVSVGIDHDTPAFAVQTIRTWWQRMGRFRYPDASSLLVTADGGGSNSSRARLWKREVQRLADDLGFPISVCHLPPGTSKWNKIEHRMFCHITENWRGRPLVSHEVIVNLIGSTTTQAGLTIDAELDSARYPLGVQVSDDEVAHLNIQHAKFHGECNYTIAPKLSPNA